MYITIESFDFIVVWLSTPDCRPFSRLLIYKILISDTTVAGLDGNISQ